MRTRRRRWRALGVPLVLAFLSAGCGKASADPADGGGHGQGSAQPAPPKPAATKPAPPQPEALVTPKPAPLPGSMPRYAGVAAIPADAYTVQTTVGGKPATILLGRASVIGGVPCAAREPTGFYNGEAFAFCTLAVDFALEGIPLQKGTRIELQTDGRLAGFRLPHPQLVLGQPVAAGEQVYLTADREALSGYTLARDHTFGSLSLKAGSKVSFAPNTPGHPLQSVKVEGHATLGGQTYGDGVRLYLEPDGTLRMVRGVAKAPAAPLACPPESTVTVTSKRSAWPNGAAFGPVVTVGVIEHNDRFPASKNPDLTVYLANYALASQGLNLSRLDPPPGKAALSLRLARARPGTMAVGTYQVGPAEDVDFRAQARLHMPGRSTLTMDSWHTEGAVELTVVEGDRVCGRFRLEDDHLLLQGTFTASAGR